MKIHIGLFVGEGSNTKGINAFTASLSSFQNIQITNLTTQEIVENDLTRFNILVFTGGSASKQALSLGKKGIEKTKNYIKNGGKYLGICAGAYLATSGFEWGLGVINVETISQTEWKRGEGLVTVTLTDEGKRLFPLSRTSFEVEYRNGPILKKSSNDSLGDYNVLALYSSEVSDNEITSGVMKNTPALLTGSFGSGLVFIVGPHFEYTHGLEYYISDIINILSA